MAFLRVDTQTILTIDETIITRSARVTVRYHIDKDDRLSTRQRKTWQLSLKEVTAADAGAYMCQLNIEPMVSQVAYLHVTGTTISPGSNEVYDMFGHLFGAMKPFNLQSVCVV